MLTDNLGYSCRVYSFFDHKLEESGSTDTKSLPCSASDLLRADLMLDDALHILLDEIGYETQQQKRIELLQEAVHLYSIAGGSLYEATANRFLGDLLIAAGRQDEALAPLSRACALEEFNSRSLANTANLTNLACAYYSLAEAYAIMGQQRLSEQCYAQSANALEKAIAIIDVKRDELFVRAIDALMTQMDISEGSNFGSTTGSTIQFPATAKTREYLRIRKLWHARQLARKQVSNPS